MTTLSELPDHWSPGDTFASSSGAGGEVVIDLRDGAPRMLGSTARVSVIVPTLNEEENVRAVLPAIPSWVHEVLLVDGGSVDGTVEAARAVRPDIRVLTEHRRGKGIALQTGWQEATGEIIVTLDADGSTDPAEIPAFVGSLLAGAGMGKGPPLLPGGGTGDMGPPGRSGNRALTPFVRLLYGGRYTDLCYGYNAFWRHAVRCFDGDADGFEIETFMNVRALQHGLRVVEVPSFERPRLHGQSNLRTFADGWRVLRTIFREHDTAQARLTWAAAGTVGVSAATIAASVGGGW